MSKEREEDLPKELKLAVTPPSAGACASRSWGWRSSTIMASVNVAVPIPEISTVAVPTELKNCPGAGGW
jgi:hypothetical protein